MDHTVVARAHANVALVKYFGKRQISLNLPAAPSLSLTLKPLETHTTLSFADSESDEVYLQDSPAEEKFAARVTQFLDIFRHTFGVENRVRISTQNNFPTAAGLASSASGFAALAVGVARLFEVELSERQLSVLARRGSGSAARSVCGGIVLWQSGQREDGKDSYAKSVASVGQWDLRLLVGIITQSPKEIGSTKAMEQTRLTSAYYPAWIDSTHKAVDNALHAVKHRDLEKLGEVTEHSAMSMHAALMATQPPIVFMKGATLEVFHLTRQLRKEGIGAYFTCDAGPQPKILCDSKDAAAVETRLREFPGIIDVLHCQLAQGASAQTI